MFKTLFLSLTFLFIGIFVYKSFLHSSSEMLSMEDTLWIEDSRNNNISHFSASPFILEKLPNKDLVFLSQINQNDKTKIYQINNTNNKDSNSINTDLKPDKPCRLIAKFEIKMLLAKIECSDGARATISFLRSGTSLFKQATNKLQENESEKSILAKLAQQESLNKEIHQYKVNLKEISNVLANTSGENPISNLLYQKYKSILSSSTLDDNKKLIVAIENKLESLDQEKKNLFRVSNYGAEIELASRINNIEWQTAVKHWNSAKNIETPQLKHQAVEQQQQHPTEMLPTQTPEPKDNSWWREF